jgi:hypothetical protein
LRPILWGLILSLAGLILAVLSGQLLLTGYDAAPSKVQDVLFVPVVIGGGLFLFSMPIAVMSEILRHGRRKRKMTVQSRASAPS